MALSYQWYKNGSPVGTDSPSYTTGTLTLGDSGASIYVEVTNASGTTTSDTVTLTVFDALFDGAIFDSVLFDTGAGGAAALASDFAAQSSLSASLSTQIPLASNQAAASTISAALTTEILLSAAPVGSATLTAALTSGIQLAAASAASSAVSANLSTQISLSASAAAVATLDASLSAGSGIEAAMAAAASVSGGLTTQIVLSGAIAGVASATADLSTGTSVAQPEERSAGSRKYARRRTIYRVKVDGQPFEFRDLAAAIDFLNHAKASAENLARQTVAAVSLRQSASTKKIEPPSIPLPKIEISSRELRGAVAETKREIARIYERAMQDCELAIMVQLAIRDRENEEIVLWL